MAKGVKVPGASMHMQGTLIWLYKDITIKHLNIVVSIFNPVEIYPMCFIYQLAFSIWYLALTPVCLGISNKDYSSIFLCWPLLVSTLSRVLSFIESKSSMKLQYYDG